MAAPTYTITIPNLVVEDMHEVLAALGAEIGGGLLDRISISVEFV